MAEQKLCLGMIFCGGLFFVFPVELLGFWGFGGLVGYISINSN